MRSNNTPWPELAVYNLHREVIKVKGKKRSKGNSNAIMHVAFQHRKYPIGFLIFLYNYTHISTTKNFLLRHTIL